MSAKKKTEKAQPGSSSVHVPAPFGSDQNKKPAAPGAANPSEARVQPVSPPAPAKATNRSVGVIPPTVANLEVEVIKAGYGGGSNDELGLFDMQQVICGVDWEMSRTPGLDYTDAQDQAVANLDTDPMYYRKRWMEADNTSDQLALTDTQKDAYDDDLEDEDVDKDTQQTEDESKSNWPTGLNLDLASGNVREPGYIGLDLYPHDPGTVVHDLTLGIPVDDGVASNIRLVNGLQYIDGFNSDPKPLLAEIQRALMPDGQFVYEGPNELYNFPEWVKDGGVDGMELMHSEELDRGEEVQKVEGQPWVKQTYRRIAVPDAATANDAEPRIGIAQYDQLPADALLAMDALGYYWSDSTSSGRGNRLSGYPSQGSLLSRTQENEDNQVGMEKPPGDNAKVTKSVTEESPAQNLYALPAQMKYPINDLSQAQQALQDASGRAEEQNVKDAVYIAYPELVAGEGCKNIEEEEHVLIKSLIDLSKKLADLAMVRKADMKGAPRRVASIAVKNGSKILMGKRRDTGKWTMPGGHVNPEETILEGAYRELQEETGVDAPKGHMRNVTHVHEKVGKDGKPLHVQGFQMDMQYKPKTTMKEDPDAEVHRWHWVDTSKGLPHHIASNMHVPLDENVVLQAMGVSAQEPVKKFFESRTLSIQKADKKKQVVYCVVLSPEELDTQDDWMTPEDIEDAAHIFMRNSRAIGSEHSKVIDAEPVESYIAPQDMNWEEGPYGPQVVKKGSWVIGIKVNDPKEWKKVEDGEYQGVSVGGFGLRD